MSLWWNIFKLKWGTLGMRKSAAEALVKFGGERAVEPLTASLKDSDGYVRRAVAKALGQIGDARAVKPLIAATLKGSDNTRQTAAEALVMIGDAAVEVLCVALQDGDKSIRQRAAVALGGIGAARAAEPLAAALKDSEWFVRQTAAEALGKLGWEPANSEQSAVLAIAQGDWNDAVNKGRASVKPLIAALKDSCSGVRESATKALGQIRDARAVEPLIAAALKDGNSNGDRYERRLAEDALVKIGAEAVEPLSAALTAGGEAVRAIAAKVLGQIGDARAVEPLIERLKSPDPKIRRSTAVALRALGWQPANTRHRVFYALAQGNCDDVLKEGSGVLEPLVEIALGSRSIGIFGEVLMRMDAVVINALIAMIEEADSAFREKITRALIDFEIYKGKNISILKFLHSKLGKSSFAEILNFAVEPVFDANKQDRFGEYTREELLLEILHAFPHALANVRISHLAQLRDYQETYNYVCHDGSGCQKGGGTATRTVEFGQLRQLARQELQRRGLEA